MESILSNTVSAIAFILYVFAAVSLTALLVRDQFRLGAANKHPLPARAWLIAGLAAVSFTTLSFEMLRFLAVKHHDWGVLRGLTTASAASYVESVKDGGRVWTWLQEDGLFGRFANELCATEASAWWVQMALMHAGMLSVYIEIEGTRREIPHLWAYHVLAQILPFSFPQNLFLLAVRLQPLRKNKDGAPRTAPLGTFWPLSTLLQISFVAFYTSRVLDLSCLNQPESILATVVAIRVWLFMPHVLMTPRSRKTFITQNESISTKPMDDMPAWDEWHHKYMWSYRIVATAYVLTFLWRTSVVYNGQSRGIGSLVQLLSGAASSSPAVAALGYDWLLGLMAVLITSGLRGPQVVSI